MQENGAEDERAFPPTAAALDEKDRGARRLFRVQAPLGALLLVIGVLGGVSGSPIEWGVAACGAGTLGLGIWMLLRYRRMAADQRYISSPSNEG